MSRPSSFFLESLLSAIPNPEDTDFLDAPPPPVDFDDIPPAFGDEGDENEGLDELPPPPPDENDPYPRPSSSHGPRCSGFVTLSRDSRRKGQYNEGMG